jgi:hypothetical protein
MGNEKYRIGNTLYNLITEDGGWTWTVAVYDWITLNIIQPAEGKMMLARKTAFVKWVFEEGGRLVS